MTFFALASRFALSNKRLPRTVAEYEQALALANRTAEKAMTERDEAMSLVVDLRTECDELRCDFVALQNVNQELMRACPSDLRELET